MSHFAHYQKRRVVTVQYDNPLDPWFAEEQPDDQGLSKPHYHITRQNHGAASRIKAGDSIWIFSQLVTPWGRFPPALDFRIDVESVSPRLEGGFRYSAKSSSRWFNLFDASPQIQRLETVDSNGNRSPLLNHQTQHVGQALQSLRELSNAHELETLESLIDTQKFEFISYRILDGTRPAFQKAIERVNELCVIFWDRWSLPRRLAERREILADNALNQHLLKVIDKASRVWAIETPNYRQKGSYSRVEFDLATARGIVETVIPNPQIT